MKNGIFFTLHWKIEIIIFLHVVALTAATNAGIVMLSKLRPGPMVQLNDKSYCYRSFYSKITCYCWFNKDRNVIAAAGTRLYKLLLSLILFTIQWLQVKYKKLTVAATFEWKMLLLLLPLLFEWKTNTYSSSLISETKGKLTTLAAIQVIVTASDTVVNLKVSPIFHIIGAIFSAFNSSVMLMKYNHIHCYCTGLAG